jgi:LmbE family N-acetylglucosaminyl deacetylase
MILVISSHPDDESLGVGATLSAIKEEKIGFCLTAHSDFQHLLPEMLCAYNELGIKYLPNWNQDFKHREFNRQAVLDTFIRLRNEFNPTMVFTHSSFDFHNDHKIVYEESVRAFKHSTILGYNFSWNNIKGCNNTTFSKLEYENVEAKLKACRSYKSQEERHYMKNDLILADLKINGLICGSKYAEAFETIRYFL